jgi:branched-chain amino acid transport system substrate-binding protein
MDRAHFSWLRLSFALLCCAIGLPTPTVDAQRAVIKVATQTPLSGEQAAIGEQIKLGAQIAVEEQVKRFRDLGFDLILVPYDDQAKPEVGVANARSIVADPDILLIVGHWNSGVALPASEVYKDAMLPMISPANTHPLITDRGYANVNRVCGRDDVQGPVGARFAARDLKIKTVYIIHNKTFYGQGIADTFQEEARRLGLKVLGYEGTEERANFAPMIIPMKAKNPDMVYFGGEYPQAGLLLRQMRERGVKSVFLGPDGIDSSEMVKIADDAVLGSYYTTVAAPAASGDFAKKFKERFNKPIEAWSMYGYDAAAVGLKAIEGTIAGGRGQKPTRSQIAAAIRSVKNFKGVTGTLAFDGKGDPVKAKYFVLKYEQKKYPGTVVKTIEQEAPKVKKTG